jgi:GSCFA family
MEFRLEFTPKSFVSKISHQHKLFLIGSCFTENIGSKLKQLKFSVLENPNGILFNPISIVKSLGSYIDNKKYREADLFYQNECWNSWEHHSRFSHPDKHTCLQMINQSQQAAHHFLKNAEWLLITVGSAFVYELFSLNSPLGPPVPVRTGDGGREGQIVANCHKVPTDKFIKKLLSPAEVEVAFKSAIEKIVAFNPSIKIIFTISPVRHLRDGFVENNRSKSALIQAIHQLVDDHDNLFYFPAYELVIDDLRDYRFYAEDMVHPNYAATNYVWEKFISAAIDEPTQLLMKDINQLNAAISHKPFNPTSAAHKKFLQVHLDKLLLLKSRLPHVDFSAEEKYFSL